MTRREIANLCCRVLAVYVIVQGLRESPQAMVVVYPLLDSMYQGSRTMIELVIRALPPLILIVSGAFLWRWSALVAVWMTGHDLQDATDEPEPRHTITKADIQCIAFSAVGLWVLADSVPKGIGIALHMLLVGLRESDPEVLWSSGWWVAAIIDVLLRTVLGSYLLFGASGLVHVLGRLSKRVTQPGYGRDQPQPPGPES